MPEQGVAGGFLASMDAWFLVIHAAALFPARQLKLVVNGRAVQSNRENILVKRGGQVAINCLVNPPYTTFAISVSHTDTRTCLKPHQHGPEAMPT